GHEQDGAPAGQLRGGHLGGGLALPDRGDVVDQRLDHHGGGVEVVGLGRQSAGGRGHLLEGGLVAPQQRLAAGAGGGELAQLAAQPVGAAANLGGGRPPAPPQVVALGLPDIDQVGGHRQQRRLLA